MRKFLILLLAIFVACGPSEVEEATTTTVQNTNTTLAPTTTTTIAPTTTTTSTTTTTLVTTTTTTLAKAASTKCDYDNNNISIKVSSPNSDGTLSAGGTATKTYNLNQLPYAELIKVNKSDDGTIISIEVCHSNLEEIQIFSKNPYCFYRFQDIKLSTSSIMETFPVTDVYPEAKKQCIQTNSDSSFNFDEVRFMTNFKNPSMWEQKYRKNIP